VNIKQRLITAAATFAVSSAIFTGSIAHADPPPAASASPSPTPSPVASPVILHAVLSESLALTSGVNATGSFDSGNGHDRATRANVSNAFVLLSKPQGTFQFALQGGAYSIPVVGVGGNKTIQTNANTDLYGPLPLAYVEYVPSGNFNVSAGVLASLTGAESTYTYLNWNIQRGSVWNVENAVSRGFRAAFTSGKLTATLGANDGFYSGRFGAAEGSLTFAPDSSDSLLFVALIPNSRTPGNPTASVANKELLNVVFTRTRGNLQIAPYILYARSPAAASLGYNGPESAFGGAFLANWTLSSHFTTAFRYETLHNSSSINDPSANADLVGYGPGSGVNTYTITPGWSNGHTFARMDLSSVRVTSSATGVAFGDHGSQRNQFRTMFEIGVQL
jgi:putative OmpL-like beta-barrel porin-2